MSVSYVVYSYFEKGCRKKCVCDNPKGNMGYDEYTVPDTVAVELTFDAFLLQSRNKSMASRAILVNFFEEQ